MCFFSPLCREEVLAKKSKEQSCGHLTPCLCLVRMVVIILRFSCFFLVRMVRIKLLILYKL